MNIIIIIIIFFLVIVFFILNFVNIIENYKNKYNVYLISNKPDLKFDYIQKINSLNLNSNDKIVRFNHSGNPTIFPARTDIAVFRNNKNSYWGYKKPIWDNLKNKEIILLGTNKITKKCIKEGTLKNNKVEVIEYKFIEGKTESSGTQIIKHFIKNNSINKIYLVGFTFYDNKINWHNFKKEKEILTKYPNKVIQL